VAFETGGSVDPSIPFAARAETSAVFVSELGPPVLAAMGIDAGAFDAEIVPGGYEGKINPAVLLTLDGSEDEARRAAAAYGHVFEQSSVLIWSEAEAGNCLVAAVTLPSVTPNLADHFFRVAGAIERGLSGGFTARGNQLLFINLRGRDGRPLSGLEDDAFVSALERTATVFGGIASVSTTRAMAALVERADYAALTGSAATVLDWLKARRGELGRR
jgi:hypothetical protein